MKARQVAAAALALAAMDTSPDRTRSFALLSLLSAGQP